MCDELTKIASYEAYNGDITNYMNAFNNLFSNKACRNVYLFIEKDASNKIFIKPGELYENLNMQIKGSFYINGATNISMRLDAS